MAVGIDIETLGRWMDAQNLPAGPITGDQLLSGGTQNVLLRFNKGGRDFVLRRPPLHLRGNSNDTMLREARVLGALTTTDVPHPGLIAACADESVIGASFYLMEPVDGFNVADGLPEAFCNAQVQHQMGLSVIDGLAKLHALDPFALGLDDFGKIDGFLERQVGRWQKQLASYGDLPGWPGSEGLGDVQSVAAWLDANRPASFVPGILHGDFHLSNVMFCKDEPRLAAIIDWELATIGDPLIDLGWLLATWPESPHSEFVMAKPWIGFPNPEELVAHYRTRSARSLDAIGWYAVFACFKLGIILEGTHARACAGKAPSETGDKLHRRAAWLFHRARHWISEGVL